MQTTISGQIDWWNKGSMTTTVYSKKMRGFYFREVSLKIKPSRNVKSLCRLLTKSREFSTSRICHITLFAKIKFSRKFLNLQQRIAAL